MGMSNSRNTVTATLIALGAAIAAVFAGQKILMRQARIARARIGKPLGEDAINANRVWKRRHGGEPVRLVLLGDSLAAGLGADRRKETLGARIAKNVASRVVRPVQLHSVAIVGSETHELQRQIEAIPKGYLPDVAVIVVGGNDVTHLIPPERATKHLAAAIEELQHMGARVVVGTCPDLGSLRPVPQPLRIILSLMSWRMARHQTRVARREGAIAVDLRRAVGPMFRAEPDELFSVDQFHPSAAGYRRTAAALAPSIIEALRHMT